MASTLSSSSLLCRSCLRRTLLHQRRAITTSPIRRKEGAVPTFSPTPLPELDSLLQSLRLNIFLPSHLPQPQRDLIYRKKNHHLLTTDEPATVSIHDEEFVLQPLDHKKDEPKSKKAFHRALGLMRDSGDSGVWKNVVGLLEGYKQARRKVDYDMKEKAVRLLADHGQLGVLINIFKRVEKTGVKLEDRSVAREALLGALYKGFRGGDWPAAAKFAENIWEMMWEGRHQNPTVVYGTGKAEGMVDDLIRPINRPEVVGLMVLVHAMCGNVKETERYTTALMHIWHEAEDLAMNESMEPGEKGWNELLLAYSPLRLATENAEKLLRDRGQEQTKFLKRAQKDVKQVTDRCLERLEMYEVKEETGRGWRTYNEMENFVKSTEGEEPSQ